MAKMVESFQQQSTIMVQMTGVTPMIPLLVQASLSVENPGTGWKELTVTH
jgi:hypothetical protein